jgi:hypothetical protein
MSFEDASTQPTAAAEALAALRALLRCHWAHCRAGAPAKRLGGCCYGDHRRIGACCGLDRG